MGVKLSIHGLHLSLVDPWMFKFDPFRVDTLFSYSKFNDKSLKYKLLIYLMQLKKSVLSNKIR
jgi:hypothetical protein